MHCKVCAACYPNRLPVLPSALRSPRGTFSAVEGGQECNPCEPGFFSNTTGAANCTACGAGRFTVATEGNVGATACTLCPRGTFKTSNATDNKCQRLVLLRAVGTAGW